MKTVNCPLHFKNIKSLSISYFWELQKVKGQDTILNFFMVDFITNEKHVLFRYVSRVLHNTVLNYHNSRNGHW